MILRFIYIAFGILLLAPSGVKGQVSEDSDLYKTIMELDASYFEAYNSCDLATQASLLSDDLEFYHDQGGLSTSKSDIINSIEKNICGKVTRELIAESVEVHEIKGFGAVEIGYHKFYNNQEPDALSKPSRFVSVWKNTDGIWKMHRVVSLH
ncbi:nuclear transport factor 2 family protein [Robiginitalea aurantiaca]|uniref:Nuclear transport factor 2 family protein n=1 Tax=Robiginitalea aurantiaca TaxID=3056915 RepID=A0ABT7WCJ0_9FLAO|nr:nuclear transport factor 2 family protein [Robiginitalea aurantiaca]MDM9630647.1 nuclear transport factor 2 family protein [Robiginitalea aurantiaca]